jgi:hypothetical protein
MDQAVKNIRERSGRDDNKFAGMVGIFGNEVAGMIMSLPAWSA